MSEIQLYDQQQKTINEQAARVLAFTSGVSLSAEMTPEQQADAIVRKAKEDPIFESMNDQAVRQIALPWAAAVRGHARRNGVNPPADILANSFNAMQNLLQSTAPNSKFTGVGAAMLESASKDMSTSEGIIKQAIFMAMSLPAQLGAATSDMCTFMPVKRDENKFYEIFNVAGTKMGSFNKGDRMDQMSSGVFSQMGRIYMHDSKLVDGVKDTYTISVEEKEGRPMPLKAGRVRVLINRVMMKAFDDGDGNINVNETHPDGTNYAVTGKIDYAKGDVVLRFTTGIPVAGSAIAIQAELDVENNPAIIPVINQKMRDHVMKPSQYVIAAEHNVQTLMSLQREFGYDLASMQFSAITQWASHEIDMKRLRKLAYHTIYGDKFDTALPEGQSWDAWCSIFKTCVSKLSTDVRDRTLKYGIRGGYAGGDAATFIKSLPASMFSFAPGYVESARVQLMGTLFGTIRIYEVPTPVCESMDREGYPFSPADILFYSRGDDIGDAGMVSGDAIPAIPFVHPTTPALVNRQTLWGEDVNEVHPREGYKYFTRLTLTNSKVGAIDPVSGRYVEKTSPTIEVESVSMKQPAKKVAVGSVFALEPTVTPDNATNKRYTLVSSDTAIVTVDDQGNATAVAAGEATVTMTSEDGKHTATAKFVVAAA